MTEIEKLYADFEKDVEYVWGVLSIDDSISTQEPNLWTMNDMSVIHHTDTDEYSIEINGMIGFFDSQKYGPKQYIGNLMDKFRDWMFLTGRDMNYPVSTYDLFITGANINTRYKSIEELYSSFDKLVTNFISSCNVD